jgi:nucleoid DNA-binding protein
MIDNHLASVGIYGDLQNVHLTQEQADLLVAFANSKGRLIGKKIYYNSLCKSQIFAKEKLEIHGFQGVDVPCLLKNSADNQLKSDLIDDVFNNLSPHIVILVSGDGDFANLVRALQKLNKKVIIFAQPGNVKQRLKELADEFYFLDELAALVGEKTHSQTNCVLSQFHYNDAIECLIEAIKTALSAGKRTDFSQIGKLMRRSPRFPTSQKFPSVYKPDGKTFSRLSQFVNAAVVDGKVRLQNQELFLIE